MHRKNQARQKGRHVPARQLQAPHDEKNHHRRHGVQRHVIHVVPHRPEPPQLHPPHPPPAYLKPLHHPPILMHLRGTSFSLSSCREGLCKDETLSDPRMHVPPLRLSTPNGWYLSPAAYARFETDSLHLWI